LVDRGNALIPDPLLIASLGVLCVLSQPHSCVCPLPAMPSVGRNASYFIWVLT
jgi:hypothetical protein